MTRWHAIAEALMKSKGHLLIPEIADVLGLRRLLGRHRLHQLSGLVSRRFALHKLPMHGWLERPVVAPLPPMGDLDPFPDSGVGVVQFACEIIDLRLKRGDFRGIGWLALEDFCRSGDE